MKPPNCAICGKDCGNGKIIYFKLRPADQKWHEKIKKINGVGHPPEAEWFCEDHSDIASELSDLTIDKAINKMKELKKS